MCSIKRGGATISKKRSNASLITIHAARLIRVIATTERTSTFVCRVCNIRFSVVYLLLCSCARVFVITACQCVRHKRKKKGKKKRLHSERSRGNFHLSDTRDIPPPWIHTYSLFVISIQIFAFRICLTFFFIFYSFSLLFSSIFPFSQTSWTIFTDDPG